MPLEDIVKWLIIAIIIVVLLFILLRIVGVHYAILPETIPYIHIQGALTPPVLS